MRPERVARTTGVASTVRVTATLIEHAQQSAAAAGDVGNHEGLRIEGDASAHGVAGEHEGEDEAAAVAGEDSQGDGDELARPMAIRILGSAREYSPRTPTRGLTCGNGVWPRLMMV